MIEPSKPEHEGRCDTLMHGAAGARRSEQLRVAGFALRHPWSLRPARGEGRAPDSGTCWQAVAPSLTGGGHF
jgi:hypothetical protein